MTSAESLPVPPLNSAFRRCAQAAIALPIVAATLGAAIAPKMSAATITSWAVVAVLPGQVTDVAPSTAALPSPPRTLSCL